MKAAISVKSPFFHNALFGLTTFGLATIVLCKLLFSDSRPQSYNCARRLLKSSYPSVAIPCSNVLRKRIALPGGQEMLQIDRANLRSAQPARGVVRG